MIASLSMYERPELEFYQNLYWLEIRSSLRKKNLTSPKQLTKKGFGLDFWENPDLVLSQTCGLPFRKYLHKTVKLVGTPDYKIKGCLPGYYFSCFVVRKVDKKKKLFDYKDSIFAFNEKDSQSGYFAPMKHVNDQGFSFKNTFETGSHYNSMKSVVDGLADITSIDIVALGFMNKFDVFTKKLKVLEKTTPTPGLPYITSSKFDSEIIFDAVYEALNNLSAEVKNTLKIKQIVKIPKEKYLSIK